MSRGECHVIACRHGEHLACDDEDCPRFQCRVYKEGRSDGIAEGRQLGYAEGYPDGMAACPLPHQG